MKRYFISFILIFISLLSYFNSHSYTLLWSTISTLSFWIAILLLLPNFFYKFLKDELVTFKRNKILWTVVGLYIAYHIILFSFFLDLTLSNPISVLTNFRFTINTGVGYSVPPPLPYFLQWVSTSPAIWFFIGPFEGTIIPFQFFTGIFLGILIGLNIVEMRRLWRISKLKAVRNVITSPFLGVISVASCCVLFPSIIIYSILTTAAAATATIFSILSSYIYFIIAYYMLPIISSLVLFYNLSLLNRVINRTDEKYENLFK